MPLVPWLFFNSHSMEGLYLKTCKRHSAPYYCQFVIFRHAVLLYRQFMIIMQPYITIYDLQCISCFLFGGQPGTTFKQRQYSFQWFFVPAMNLTRFTVKFRLNNRTEFGVQELIVLVAANKFGIFLKKCEYCVK